MISRVKRALTQHLKPVSATLASSASLSREQPSQQKSKKSKEEPPQEKPTPPQEQVQPEKAEAPKLVLVKSEKQPSEVKIPAFTNLTDLIPAGANKNLAAEAYHKTSRNSKSVVKTLRGVMLNLKKE